MFQVLLFYKYINVLNPQEEMIKQRNLCERLHLKGRVIVSFEGINATLEGITENTEKYIREMEKSDLFRDISYKKSKGTGNVFPRLKVKVRPEIVTTGIPNLNPKKVTGKYITAAELHQWFEEKRKLYIVDMRNDYEYASGHFEGFTPSGLHNFFELKDIIPNLTHLKNKVIVTVCTGGVRCEKASGFLVSNGFKNVYQLKDGIQTYMELYPNEHFKGKLYVFDSRLTIGFNTNSKEHEIVGKCMHCSTPCDSYVNCEYDMCHLHYICCENCKDKETGMAFCKLECKDIYLKNKSLKSQATVQ